MNARDTARVEILLATYNNGLYLAELLESLLAQDYDDFHLVVSDDCSSDETWDILQQYALRFRNEVKLVRRETPSGSAKANFGSLMQMCEADYVLLCDADDVWFPGKVLRSLKAIREAEASWGLETPILVFSDAAVVDAKTSRAHESYRALKKINADLSGEFSYDIINPPMLGCASIMNRALVKLARDIPIGRVTGHDWWAYLVASAFGRVKALPDRTMAYRIHGNNSSRPKEVRLTTLARLGNPIREVRRRIAIRREQAAALMDVFGERLPPQKRLTIERFLETANQGFVRRRVTLIRNRLLYPDPLRNLAVFLFV